MRVRIVRSCFGTENGATIRVYNAGQVRSIDDDLARIFIEAGTAEPVEPPVMMTREVKEPVRVGETIPIVNEQNDGGGKAQPTPRRSSRRGKR